MPDDALIAAHRKEIAVCAWLHRAAKLGSFAFLGWYVYLLFVREPRWDWGRIARVFVPAHAIGTAWVIWAVASHG